MLSWCDLRMMNICKATASVKEATELIGAGYENVCDVEKVKLFRRRR